jgi:protein-S-isoprenylcysteine O-methyltransferase Ste14
LDNYRINALTEMSVIDTNINKPIGKFTVWSAILALLGWFIVIAMTLFLVAGTIKWIAGWCFLILYGGFALILGLWMFRCAPSLVQERMTGLRKLEDWDKVFMFTAIICFFAWFTLMPLDAVRFHWSHMPVWLQVVGGLILVTSFYLFYLVVRENPYLSSAARIQKERGQTVVSTGPYRYVRHPMYAAYIPFIIGTALLLGSWYGVLAAPIFVGLLAIRALKEERLLRKELEGYDIYMAQVKYRFIPYVW